MNALLEEIMAKRNAGTVIARIEPRADRPLRAFVEACGLHWVEDALHGVSRSLAQHIVCAILRRDLAYSYPIMDQGEAERLARAYFAALGQHAYECFTNADFATERDGLPDLGGWMPMTNAT